MITFIMWNDENTDRTRKCPGIACPFRDGGGLKVAPKVYSGMG